MKHGTTTPTSRAQLDLQRTRWLLRVSLVVALLFTLANACLLYLVFSYWIAPGRWEESPSKQPLMDLLDLGWPSVLAPIAVGTVVACGWVLSRRRHRRGEPGTRTAVFTLAATVLACALPLPIAGLISMPF